ncbi:MAG: hypothetical protein LQ338_005749 [Usnochroma carphineum]|nr:MAG: hypothetical protein LQ338_005749 [Usnochroma carphineum]
MAANSTQAQSIQARIAALNLGHVGRAPVTATPAEDESLPRPSLAPRSQTTNLPATLSNGHQIGNGIGNEPNGIRQNAVLPPPTIARTGERKAPPPALPPRKQSTQPSPALPPRRPSDALRRRGSNASVSSTLSSISAVSVGTNGTARTSTSRTPSMDAGRKLAPVFDQATLPPLPPKRTPEQVERRYQDIERSRMGLKPTESMPKATTVDVAPPPTLPVRPSQRPPQTPLRKESFGAAKKLPPENAPAMPARSALAFGMNKPQEPMSPNLMDGEAASAAPVNGPPPPIPTSSKPDLSSILATKPKPTSSPHPTSQPASSACLTCRDFSAPDAHAAKFPRETVPSIDWLATQLTSPFPSPVDQARAIFTWLHHNIAYDIIAFCNKAVRPSTPANTLSTGLAVCEGYAGLFTAIASKAGLESLVVSGHGKGAGFSPLQPGEPLPAEYSTHAWNAVKIDNGEWKLIDACWGAGHVCIREQKYTKRFAPRYFTMNNDEFGLRHFPTNKSLFYRTDGRNQVPWEEYILGPLNGQQGVTVYQGVAEEEGIAETSVRPARFHIPSSPNMIVRFRFSKVCEHWDPVRNGPGKPYPYLLALADPDAGGSGKEYRVFETDGRTWWLDVESRFLGRRGQSVDLYTVTTVDGRSARGMGAEECRRAIGRMGMSFGGVAKWELV